MSPETSDPLGLISGAEAALIGTVVSAAVIAYGAGHVDSIGQLCIAIVGTVIVYWLAHLHAVTLARSLAHREHPLAAIRVALAETWPIAGAALVPLVILVLADLVDGDLLRASWVALWATVALLAIYSYVAGLRAGLSLWGRLAGTAAGAGIGVLVALLKVALH